MQSSMKLKRNGCYERLNAKCWDACDGFKSLRTRILFIAAVMLARDSNAHSNTNALTPTRSPLHEQRFLYSTINYCDYHDYDYYVEISLAHDHVLKSTHSRVNTFLHMRILRCL